MCGQPQDGESLAADSEEEEEGGIGAGGSTRAEVGSSIAGSRQAGASVGGPKSGRCAADMLRGASLPQTIFVGSRVHALAMSISKSEESLIVISSARL